MDDIILNFSVVVTFHPCLIFHQYGKNRYYYGVGEKWFANIPILGTKADLLANKFVQILDLNLADGLVSKQFWINSTSTITVANSVRLRQHHSGAGVFPPERSFWACEDNTTIVGLCNGCNLSQAFSYVITASTTAAAAATPARRVICEREIGAFCSLLLRSCCYRE